MKTKKDRRSSGRVESKSTLNIPKKEIIHNCLEPQEHWSDWDDYRDGQRTGHLDKTKKKPKNCPCWVCENKRFSK